MTLRSLQDKEATLYRSFSALGRGAQLQVAWEILRAQTRILFSKKFIWSMVALLVYFGVGYVINYREDMRDRMTQEDILWFLEIPLAALAIFLNMLLVSSEKDNRTLEVMFTTAGSRYRVWLLRLGALNLILLAISLGLAGLAFFTIADIEVIGTAIHSFIPAFFIGGVTVYFSVKFRSGFAAGMMAGIVMFLLLMFTEPLEDTKYQLFFNPYNVPRELDAQTWYFWMWQNRIALICMGLLTLFFTLRGLEQRERLLR